MISSDCNESPVALPPGRARLANTPAATGSEAMAKTIGIVCEAFFAAMAAAMLSTTKGFVLTGADTTENRRPLETSRPGIFAIGDVRSGSVKRVAAAVGEGAQVVATLHATLASAGREQAVILKH
jgi:thioredoxin reductase